MEETNNKLTYEQLEMIVNQLQNRVIQAESKLTAINMAQLRFELLLKVLDRKDVFNNEFIEKCTSEIEELLSTEPQTQTKE